MQPGVVDTHVVFCALLGAISWKVITWYEGIPGSSSRALIGGNVGAVIAKADAGCADCHRLCIGHRSRSTHLDHCFTAIGAGNMFGDWPRVKAMGQKITKLKPLGGFCAETDGAITLFLATAMGVPVSTTHTITGAIVDVGSTQRASAVRWVGAATSSEPGC